MSDQIFQRRALAFAAAKGMVMNSFVPDHLRVAMLAMARSVMDSRPPDFTAGDSYLQRWHLGKYGTGPNAYIHRFTGDDADGALHDHPYDNVSVVLLGCYMEHLHCNPLNVVGGRYATYSLIRREGEVVQRGADVAHRLSMVDADPVISLFFTGTRFREWGFHCPRGWVHYKEFLTANSGRKECP